MENKYSIKTQNEINYILESLESWKSLFFIEVSYYYEGWAISLKEKNVYPRLIVIFGPYDKKHYSVKSFEIHYDDDKNESYKEIYSNDEIENLSVLLKEVKDIIYGKDIINFAKNNYYDKVVK